MPEPPSLLSERPVILFVRKGLPNDSIRKLHDRIGGWKDKAYRVVAKIEEDGTSDPPHFKLLSFVNPKVPTVVVVPSIDHLLGPEASAREISYVLRTFYNAGLSFYPLAEPYLQITAGQKSLIVATLTWAYDRDYRLQSRARKAGGGGHPWNCANPVCKHARRLHEKNAGPCQSCGCQSYLPPSPRAR
jgi:hypothetical protein